MPARARPDSNREGLRNETREDRRSDLVLLDGLSVRRRRHARGWSPRDLVAAIEAASLTSSGLRRSLSPNQIEAVEERSERIPYALVLLLADGLGCDPIDLIAEGELSSKRPRARLH